MSRFVAHRVSYLRGDDRLASGADKKAYLIGPEPEWAGNYAEIERAEVSVQEDARPED